MTKAHSAPQAPDPARSHSRYQLQEQLGRGGMASVYRALDQSTGEHVALKLLATRKDQGDRERSLMTTLFEREYHTLAQLRHPHVIEVYDYGQLADGTPFYTMELLDGGDVRERAPLPWQIACALFFDVCSSLALLHSRRLLHRDISPPNIRCTQTGRAKLIDFGAMSPMSAGGADVVGTPAFAAPETLHRLTLDARTDLYSLGATLYYALTGTTPYPAKTFSEALAAWSGKVRAPSTIVPGIPSALDDLVLSLVSIEPALRPQSAFHVMQVLAALAGLPPTESDAVGRAYLATPALVGREGALAEFRHHLLSSRLSRGRALLLHGGAGAGRSRLLDACSLEAKTLGFSVLRASARNAHRPFETVRRLLQHLRAALPDESEPLEPPELSDASASIEQLQRTCTRYLWAHSARRPILFAVDDVHDIDAPSAAVLAGLLDRAGRGRVFVLLSADDAAPESPGLLVLARRAGSLEVEPLTKKQTRALFASVFGDVANLDLLALEAYAVSSGVPRHCMDVAQQLVDRGVIHYASGSWTLPSELATSDLPQSAADAVRARVAELSESARFVAEGLALSFGERLSESQIKLLLPAADKDEVLSELIANEVVLRLGSEYALPNRLWSDALTRALAPDDARARHRALAELYRPRNQVAYIYHAFAGGLDEAGLEALSALNAGYAQKLDQAQIYEDNVAKMMVCYPRALASAEALGKGPRFLNELRRWRTAGALLEDGSLMPDSAASWCAQLRHDSGFDLYQSDPDYSDPMQRLLRALQAAQTRYDETPEAQRVYSVEEAIRLLAEYVVIAIGYSGRSMDSELLRTLPALLEPFAPLTPILDAIWQNAQATALWQGSGQFSLARERWIAVLEKLDACKSDEMPYVEAIANAVAFGIGVIEAQLGMASASRWAERLDREPSQRVAALQLRRIVQLQQGDVRGAERFRRQAERLSLSSRVPQMFKALLAVELTACANTRDLAGIKDVTERMRPIAARFASWRPNLLYAEACFHLARGDYAAAMQKCEECIELTKPDVRGLSSNILMWTAAHVCLGEVLSNTGQAARARDLLARLHEPPAPELRPEAVRVLALVEAKLDDDAAIPRLQALIEKQRELGVSGLHLGLSYEARAQIAIWQRDAAAFEEYATLAAHEFRYGADSALGARYARLLNEASRAGLQTSATLEYFATTAEGGETLFTSAAHSAVQRSFAPTQSVASRLQSALQLICNARQVSDGQLFVCRAGGLQLAATQGNAPTLADLGPLQQLIGSATEHARQLEEMSTDELASSAKLEPAKLRVGDSELELLPLSAVVDGVRCFAGVVAIAVGSGAADELRERQLLSSIAAQLLALESVGR
jgi:hypothetical protein